MISTYDKSQNCLFCNKPKTWMSMIMIVDPRTRRPLAIVTVCPEDRKKHTISEVYEEVISKLAEETKDEVW